MSSLYITTSTNTCTRVSIRTVKLKALTLGRIVLLPTVSPRLPVAVYTITYWHCTVATKLSARSPLPSLVSQISELASYIDIVGAHLVVQPAIIFLYNYLYIYYLFISVSYRRALNLLRASFSPIFQYFSAVNVPRVSFSPIFQYFLT